MIPLRDVIPSRTAPVVTVTLIGINILAFFLQMAQGPETETFVRTWGLVPAMFSWVTVFTSMFLHGGLFHLGGNMLYLWIFGDNVEDRFGHGRFLIFYLAAGAAANLAQAMATPTSLAPVLGASGAIAHAYVQKAAPDGHTLGISMATQTTVNPAVNTSMPYDTEKDIAPIAHVASQPFVFTVHPAVAATSMKAQGRVILPALRDTVTSPSSSG